jgi:hypothetical protein
MSQTPLLLQGAICLPLNKDPQQNCWGLCGKSRLSKRVFYFFPKNLEKDMKYNKGVARGRGKNEK